MNTPQQTDLEKLPHNKQVLFACFCAEQVIHLVPKEHQEVCKVAIETAYKFLEGKATQEDCAAAYAAAAYAAYASAYAADAASAYAAYAAYAAYTAYSAAHAAAYAADAAAKEDREAIIKAQWNFYDNLLNTDKYFEEIVLGSKI